MEVGWIKTGDILKVYEVKFHWCNWGRYCLKEWKITQIKIRQTKVFTPQKHLADIGKLKNGCFWY